MSLITITLFVFTTPVVLFQTEQAHPIYTYVRQFQVPRANWAHYAKETEKTVNPIFERLFADKTLVGWGNFGNIVHTADGMTYGACVVSTSLSGITRVLDELRKAGPRPGQIAATKHEDLLMRTVRKDSPDKRRDMQPAKHRASAHQQSAEDHPQNEQPVQEEDGSRTPGIQIQSQRDCIHLLEFTASGQKRHTCGSWMLKARIYFSSS